MPVVRCPPFLLHDHVPERTFLRRAGRGRAAVWLIVLDLLSSAPAAAQPQGATLLVAAELADGSVAGGARIQLTGTSFAAPTHDLLIGDAAPVRFAALGAGTYRLRVTLPGHRPAERMLDARAGTLLRAVARLAPESGSAETRVFVEYESSVAHQIAFDDTDLERLPGSRTAWGLLEVAHPFLIVDRIDTGGLWSAAPALLAGYGSAAGQTTFRFGGLDITDPQAPGTPMLYPDLAVIGGVSVDSMLRPADSGAAGAVVTLIPKPPGAAWSGEGLISLTPGGAQADRTGDGIPFAARYESWTDGSLVVGGPLLGRVGLVASSRATRSSRLERAEPIRLPNDVTTGYAHLTAAAGRDHVRVTLAGHDSTRPYAGRVRFADRALEERGRAALGAVSWDRYAGALWSVDGGAQWAATRPTVPATAGGGVIERLLDGPPLALADAGHGSRRRLDVKAAITPDLRRWGGSRHVLRAGGSLRQSSARLRPVAQPVFAELIDGRPARVWDVAQAGGESVRRTLGAVLFLQDQIDLARTFTLHAGLRLEHDRGTAAGSSSAIRWTTLSPRLSAVWHPAGGDQFLLRGGYARYGHRLLTSALGIGDPGGATGVMYRWDDADGDGRHVPQELTAVAAVGGCCSDQGPHVIDPRLRRPQTEEVLLSLEHTIGSWRWRVTGIDRRERHQLGLVNVGVTLDDYSVTTILDPGVDVAGRAGFTDLPVFNRLAGSFGQDRYRLTNPPGADGRYQSGEVTIDRSLGDRWRVRFGGLVQWARVVGASRGFRVSENDQGLLGETFITPNAQTNSRGRPFFDRAYIIKVSGTYLAPGDVRLAAAARYQDGQPFARVVVAEGLRQGPEIIHAYRRGGQRFTYTMTLDLRAERHVSIGRWSVGLVGEAFNVLNRALEVEEDIVTGPAFRTVTAVQPPRAFRVGLRIAY